MRQEWRAVNNTSQGEELAEPIVKEPIVKEEGFEGQAALLHH